MITILNGSTFSSQSDLLLIPIDSEGDISPDFAEFFEEHELDVLVRGLYELGEVQVIDYGSNSSNIRYIAFCCTFDTDFGSSSYQAVDKIGHEVGKWLAQNKQVKKVASPLLGTGAGRLLPEVSQTVFLNAFKAAAPPDVSLAIYIRNPEKHLRLQKHLETVDDKILWIAGIELAKEDPVISEIRQSKKFYYSLAQDKYYEFDAHSNPELGFYTNVRQKFKDSKLTFREYLSTIDRASDEFEFLELCGQLVAYIDFNAYLKNLWNKNADKRVLAKSGVNQTNWITNLIKYKEKGNSYLNLPSNIKNAFKFLQQPDQEISMLSENHRAMVFEKLLSFRYQGSEDLSMLFDYFSDFDLTTQEEINDGVLITRLLYHPNIKPLWLDKGETQRYHDITEAFPPESAIDEAYRLIYECYTSKSLELDLGNCGIRSLTHVSELFECVHLEKLILSNEWSEWTGKSWKREESENPGRGNILDHIPSEMAQLKNLKSLTIGGNWSDTDEKYRWKIKNIDAIKGLTKLEYLNISNNLVEDLGPISKFINLNSLHLNNNKIHKIPDLSHLTNLKELYLSNNQITDLNFLKKVTSLQTLDLHRNQIATLTTLEFLIKKLNVTNTKWDKNTVNVASNPLVEPSMKTVMMGKEAVIRYFKEIAERETFINKEIKLILVGNSEAGKTTLAKYLDHKKDFNVPHHATHWLEEKTIQWDYFESDELKQFTIRLFDFGGHDYYHDTHHIFFTHNSLYILVWEKDTDHLNKRELKNQIDKSAKPHSVVPSTQDYPLDYWLDSVAHFTKEVRADNFDFESEHQTSYSSLLLLLQNKVDKVKKIKPLNYERYRSNYPFIYESLNVDLLAERNTAHMMGIINEMLNDAKILSERLPKYYLTIKEALVNYDLEPVITINEFNYYCNEKLEFPIDIVQTRDLAEHLKHLGLIVWFPKNQQDDKVYIDKRWLIENIRKALAVFGTKKGKLVLADIQSKVETLDSVRVRMLMEAMMDYKMVFKHPYSEEYIAPLYLPEKPAHTIEIFLSNTRNTHRRFQYIGYIQKNVILQLFQKYGRLIPEDLHDQTKGTYYYWKHGLIIKDLITREIVLINFNMGESYGEACIDIFHLGGPDSPFIDEVTDYIREITKDYTVDEQVSLDGIDFISLKLLNDYASQGRYEFTEKTMVDNGENKDSDKIVKVYKLKDYTKYIKTMKKLKVAISYSKRDIEKVNTFLRYLNPLVQDDLIELPWYCSDLEAGCEWNEEIEKTFQDADIVFFMMSDHFFDTQYILEHEIPNTIDRYRSDKSVKIVPILLVHYPWGGKAPYNLQDFTALPFQAKPISDFKDLNMAWYMVSKKIRIMIEKSLDPGKKGGIDRELKALYERQVEGKLDNNS